MYVELFYLFKLWSVGVTDLSYGAFRIYMIIVRILLLEYFVLCVLHLVDQCILTHSGQISSKSFRTFSLRRAHVSLFFHFFKDALNSSFVVEWIGFPWYGWLACWIDFAYQ